MCQSSETITKIAPQHFNVVLVAVDRKLLTFYAVIVYYVPRFIMRVITRRATILAGDQSRGAISPASILSESRNYPNCVHWQIFYFMWLRCVYEFLCVHSNPIWKDRNCRDYRRSHLTFREYFQPFWISRFCVVVAYCNRCMRSSNV